MPAIAASAPRFAVGPEPAAQWVMSLVEECGGRVVEPEAADAILWTNPADVAGLQTFLDRAPQARWVQLPWAGVEAFATAGIFDHDRTWTCGKGVYAEPVAEHALALALALARDLPDRVRATSWARPSGQTLFDASLTVLGGGGITEVLLQLVGPMRMETTVMRRKPAPIDGADLVVGPDRLHDALATADVVILALALTPETAGIIDKRALASMREDALLINVARGKHVVTDDLTAALQVGTIRGAGLDVTDPEPLPDGHPLWDLPNCIITPHVANTPEMGRHELGIRLRENIRRFAAGEPLLGPVDPSAGY